MNLCKNESHSYINEGIHLNYRRVLHTCAYSQTNEVLDLISITLLKIWPFRHLKRINVTKTRLLFYTKLLSFLNEQSVSEEYFVTKLAIYLLSSPPIWIWITFSPIDRFNLDLWKTCTNFRFSPNEIDCFNYKKLRLNQSHYSLGLCPPKMKSFSFSSRYSCKFFSVIWNVNYIKMLTQSSWLNNSIS